MFLNVHALDKNSIVWFLFGLMLRGVTKNTFDKDDDPVRI